MWVLDYMSYSKTTFKVHALLLSPKAMCLTDPNFILSGSMHEVAPLSVFHLWSEAIDDFSAALIHQSVCWTLLEISLCGVYLMEMLVLCSAGKKAWDMNAIQEN